LKEAPAIYVEGRTQGYRLRLTVQEAINISKDIFVFQKQPADTAGNVRSAFTNVASPADLQEYPVGYDSAAEDVFFRLSQIDVIFRTLDLLNDAWRLIEIDIRALLASLCEMDNFVEEVVEFGTRPSSSSSGSSLPSGSSA
jgi:hypothetical protein